MTALVVLLTGAYKDPALQGKGAEMTATAFGSAIPGAEVVLAIIICLFAYSTMISWEYYGERAWEYLFGSGSLLIFRLLFVAFVFIGAISQLANVIAFSDLMILSMAFPNIIGGIILSPQIKAKLQDYWGRLQRGEMQRFK
jgi:AGCS family alanine or glycine:cation symporter